MIIAEKPKPAVIEEEPLEDDNDSDHKNFEQSSDEDEEESKKELDAPEEYVKEFEVEEDTLPPRDESEDKWWTKP